MCQYECHPSWLIFLKLKKRAIQNKQMENLQLLKIHTVEEHSTVTGLWLTISFPLHNKPKHLDTALFLLQKF